MASWRRDDVTHSPMVLSGAERHPQNRMVTSGDSADYLKKLTTVMSEGVAVKGRRAPLPPACRLLPPTLSLRQAPHVLWLLPVESLPDGLQPLSSFCFPWPFHAGFVTPSLLVSSSVLSRGSTAQQLRGDHEISFPSTRP